MTQLLINTDALVVLTDKLARLNRSALPVAIRQTLNNAAFDVKQKTLEQSASKNFIRRSPNFFKRFSGVIKADGFDISRMRATVGMTTNGQLSAEAAVKNMNLQESGGVIREGGDYLKAARGGNLNKRVSRSNYFDKSKLVKGNFNRARTTKSKFVAAAFVSMRDKKPMSVQTDKGRFLMQVTSFRKSKKGQLKINSKLLMKDRGSKPAKISATHFAREAAEMTASKMAALYKIEAEKQFARALRG